MALMKRADQLVQNQTLPNAQSHTGDLGQRTDLFTNQQAKVHDTQLQRCPVATASTPSSMQVHADASFRAHASATYTSVLITSLPLAAQGGLTCSLTQPQYLVTETDGVTGCGPVSGFL